MTTRRGASCALPHKPIEHYRTKVFMHNENHKQTNVAQTCIHPGLEINILQENVSSPHFYKVRRLQQ